MKLTNFTKTSLSIVTVVSLSILDTAAIDESETVMILKSYAF